MKIGILTFHRALNPGAVLQCYALYEFLKERGHDVKVIDYRQNYIEYLYKLVDKNIFKKWYKNLRTVLGAIRRLPFWYYNSFKYRYFVYKNIRLSKRVLNKFDIPNDYNLYIIGSDQLWGLHCTKDIDDVYMGDFLRPNMKIITYAVSTNIESLEKIGSINLTKYINNFSGISFREKVIKDKVYKMTGVEGSVVLDPTLLVQSQIWNRFIKKRKIKENYILTCFFRANNDLKNKLDRAVFEFAKKYNYNVVDLMQVSKSPQDFINLINYSSLIFTSSFHAITFSMIFQKSFYAVKFNDGHDSRYEDLLIDLNLSDRLLDTNLNISNVTDIDYATVNNEIYKLRLKSLSFLSSFGV